MAKSLKSQIAANKRRTWLYALFFLLLMGVVGLAFSYLYRSFALFFWFFGAASFYVLIQYFLASRLALFSAGAKATDAKRQPRLYRITSTLASEAKLPLPKLYIIEDPAANAFATGISPDKASVAVTTGLIDLMDDKELAAVIGHELSHIKNYDVRLNMLIFGLVSVLGFLSDFCLRALFFSNRRDDDDRSAVGIFLALIIILLSPLLAMIVQFAISRQREFLADASSAAIIKNPSDMASALRKLEIQARPMRRQNVASAAMYITNPMRKSLLKRLFSVHPPLEDRIARLEGVKI